MQKKCFFYITHNAETQNDYYRLSTVTLVAVKCGPIRDLRDVRVEKSAYLSDRQMRKSPVDLQFICFASTFPGNVLHTVSATTSIFHMNADFCSNSPYCHCIVICCLGSNLW